MITSEDWAVIHLCIARVPEGEAGSMGTRFASDLLVLGEVRSAQAGESRAVDRTARMSVTRGGLVDVPHETRTRFRNFRICVSVGTDPRGRSYAHERNAC